MLSDEEKKAIDKISKLVEYLRKWNENFTVVPEDAKYFEKILDMTKTHIRMIDENIEELLQQSKEIEELKEKNKFLNWYFENQKDNFVHKDKIKAIIEELEKEKNIPEEMDFKAFYRIKDLKNIEIAVMQSLLEKE